VKPFLDDSYFEYFLPSFVAHVKYPAMPPQSNEKKLFTFLVNLKCPDIVTITTFLHLLQKKMKFECSDCKVTLDTLLAWHCHARKIHNKEDTACVCVEN
jgi:hypothetical protein